MRKLYVPVSVITALLSARPAAAQDVDSFNFSGAMFDRQGTLQLSHPKLGQAGSYYAGLGMAYADDPLVLQYPSGREEEVVAAQFSTRLAAGYNLGGRVRFDLEVPVYPTVKVSDSPASGEDPTFSNVFAMGNIRLGATIPLLTYEDEGVGVAATPFLELPTGRQDAYLSSGGFGGGLKAAVGGQVSSLGWNVEAGVLFAKASELDPSGDTDPDSVLTLGSSVVGGLGLHYDITPEFLVGAEGTAALPFVGGFGPWTRQDLEAHLYGSHVGETGLVVTLGGGTGVMAGVGAPDFRVLLAVAYHTPDGPGDRDLDGITDDKDQCPDDPEDKDQFQDQDGCPDPDNDKDGILDVGDACPNDPEDFDGFEDQNGCPDPDNDKDGILDGDDACPLEPGPAKTQGCPDRDGDGVIDKVDECPNEPGPVETNGCPDSDGDLVPDFRDKCPNQPVDRRADTSISDGCPSKVIVTKAQIVILDKIYFDFNKSSIKPVSFPLLAEIATVINNNPQIKQIEVAGHTDNVGADEYNLKLSQARVDAVVKHLVKFGNVDPARLVAMGYGESKPIDTNDTEEGRAMNRRVDFNILRQD